MKRVSYIIMILAVTIMPGILSVCTASDIYKLTDEHGHITYTNTPIKGAKKLQFNVFPSVTSRRTAVKPSAAITTIAAKGYPKVSKPQQQQRDIKRRQILTQELAAETKLLENVLQTLDLTLQTPPNVPDHRDILQLRNQVASHERNIQALKIELNNF